MPSPSEKQKVEIRGKVLGKVLGKVWDGEPREEETGPHT